jgi:putative membrane protein
MNVALLPHLNASLNAAATVAIALGWMFIRQGRRQAHKKAMLTALVISAVFLVSYLIYHFNSGLAKFGGEGIVRPIYFTLLITHVTMAAVITAMVPVTLMRALKDRIELHRKIAPWTASIWLFVSVSGVVVYVMAVHVYPWLGS